jgi:hypothetical protein
MKTTPFAAWSILEYSWPVAQQLDEERQEDEVVKIRLSGKYRSKSQDSLV